LNGVFGGVNRGDLRLCQKRAFLERLKVEPPYHKAEELK
jgi:hypothetical protein